MDKAQEAQLIEAKLTEARKLACDPVLPLIVALIQPDAMEKLEGAVAFSVLAQNPGEYTSHEDMDNILNEMVSNLKISLYALFLLLKGIQEVTWDKDKGLMFRVRVDRHAEMLQAFVDAGLAVQVSEPTEEINYDANDIPT